MRFDSTRPSGYGFQNDLPASHMRVLRTLEQTKQHSVPLGAQFDALAAQEREPLEVSAPLPSLRLMSILGVLGVVFSVLSVRAATPVAPSLFLLFAEWALIFGLGTVTRLRWFQYLGVTAASLGIMALLGALGAAELGVAILGAFIIAVTCGGWWQGMLRQRELREAETRDAFLRRN